MSKSVRGLQLELRLLIVIRNMKLFPECSITFSFTKARKEKWFSNWNAQLVFVKYIVAIILRSCGMLVVFLFGVSSFSDLHKSLHMMMMRTNAVFIFYFAHCAVVRKKYYSFYKWNKNDIWQLLKRWDVENIGCLRFVVGHIPTGSIAN